MRTAKLLLLTLLPLAPLACSVDAEPEVDAAETDRQPLGKADAIGSCQAEDGADFCGGPSQGNCWCDDLCHTFGDCCADKVDTCDGPEEGPTLCMHEDHCGSDQICDHTECHSNCPPDMVCPAVCWGECVDAPTEPEPSYCLQDTHCSAGEYCDHSECLSNCPPDMFCPAVCWGQCLPDTPAGPSCEGHCDGPGPDAACWCDELCESFGDCCDDYADACVGADPCEALESAFLAETAAIRSCTADDECGQVLPGTSCGCTRNWVARLDADTSTFDAIMDEANQLGCMLPGLISTCDCPPADGFACEAGVCGWNYSSF